MSLSSIYGEFTSVAEFCIPCYFENHKKAYKARVHTVLKQQKEQKTDPDQLQQVILYPFGSAGPLFPGSNPIILGEGSASKCT